MDDIIVYKSLDEITPYERNPRNNAEAVGYVKESIRQFGFKVPIVIDRNNIIVAGHTRYKAAVELELENVPCIVADDLTDKQIKAFRLADNKTGEFSTWDFELLSEELEELKLDFNFNDFGFEFDEEEPEEAVEDDFDIDSVDPAECEVEFGDVYQLGRHRLMCGDSTNGEMVATLTEGIEVDMVLTDPPYNVDYEGTAGKIINDNLGNEEFKAFLTSAFSLLSRELKKGGAFYIWLADKEDVNFRIACEESGLTVKQQLIWVKNHFVLGRQDYQWIHEPCLYGWKDGAAHYFIDDRSQSTVVEDVKPDIKKMKKEEMAKLLEELYSDRMSTSVIREDKPLRNDLHPTMKPVKLLAKFIKNSSRENEVVLDLFGGSGSTLIACEQLNRQCYMMEYEPKFVDVIIKRWEEFTGEKAIKL